MSFNPDLVGVMGPSRGPDQAESDHALTAPIESVPVAPAAIEYSAPTPAPDAGPVGVEPAALVAPAAPEMRLSWPALEAAKMADRPRARRGWISVVAVGLVGLIAAGALGYLLYATTGQRDSARREAASTRATLTSTQGTLELHPAGSCCPRQGQRVCSDVLRRQWAGAHRLPEARSMQQLRAMPHRRAVRAHRHADIPGGPVIDRSSFRAGELGRNASECSQRGDSSQPGADLWNGQLQRPQVQ